MKRSIVITLLSIVTVALLYIGAPHIVNHTVAAPAGQLRIAIFTPITHPALEEVELGFKETLQKGTVKPCVFTTFNANGNRTLLRAQAEEIAQGNYDLICTLGASCSQVAAELLNKKGIATPHIFCAVDGHEFAAVLQATNRNSTGVYVKLDYTKEMDVLHALTPAIKNILLVYDPTHGTGLEKYKKEIEQYIKKFGTTLSTVEIYQTNEIQQKVAALLPSMDVVLVLVDNTVVAGIDALITLCNRYGVTLLASDLASGTKGAALAYGITEYESGSGAAHQALAILRGKKPHELPVTAITTFRVAVNKSAMQQQKLVVDEEMLQQFTV